MSTDCNAKHTKLTMFIQLRFHPVQCGHLSNSAQEVFGKALAGLQDEMSWGSSHTWRPWHRDALPCTA